MATAGRRAPWHLWPIGLLSALFNGYGAYDFWMTQIGDAAYMELAGNSMGVDGPTMIAFFQRYPAWMNASWGLGVFAALGGSLLLLARSRYAVPVFGLAIVGLIVTTAGQLRMATPAWADTLMAHIIGVMVWAVQVFLLIYAASMRRRGVLR